jgi:hypothetical protein
MNTSDSNEFMDPFGFVDAVDPAEREMRDREYDALVAAGQVEFGTASIADLLASTDPALEGPDHTDEEPCCRWCGLDCDGDPPPAPPSVRAGSVAGMLAAMVTRPVDARTRTAVEVIDPMTLTGPAVRDYLALTDKLVAVDTALQHTAVLAVAAAATAEVDAHVAGNPLTERGVKWRRADTDRTVREDLERTLNITPGDAEGRLELALDLRDRLPATRALLATGMVSARKAWQLSARLGITGDRVAGLLDAELAPVLQGSRPATLRRRIARRLLALDPDTANAQDKATIRDRNLRRWTNADGSRTLSITGPPDAVDRAWYAATGTALAQLKDCQDGCTPSCPHALTAAIIGPDDRNETWPEDPTPQVPEADLWHEPEEDLPDDTDDVRTEADTDDAPGSRVRTDVDIADLTLTAPVLPEADSSGTPNTDVRTETDTTAAADGDVPAGADIEGSLPLVRVRPETDTDDALGADVRTDADNADLANPDVLPPADSSAIQDGDVRGERNITTSVPDKDVRSVADITGSVPQDDVPRRPDTNSETHATAAEHVRPGADTTIAADSDGVQVQTDRSVRLEQARFDAAIDLLTSAFEAPWYPQGKGRRRTMVQLVTTVATLTGGDEDVSELVGYGPVTAMTARRIAADADLFQDLQVHPTMGFLMDAGTLRHDPPPALRDFLTARRLTCAMTGCQQRAIDTDLDHGIEHRPDGTGGPTAAWNLEPMCRFHHRARTLGLWKLAEKHIDGSMTWIDPAGRSYRQPAQDLRPGADC